MHPRTSTRSVILILHAMLLVAVSPLTSWAATWRVEKDGSGDFEIIQDALDAAAPGDSILIGPGRFDTFRPGVSAVDGFRFSAIAWVRTTGLTLIGAGPQSTVVGLSSLAELSESFPTAGLYVYGGAVTQVHEMGFENSKFDVTLRETSALENCRVVRTHTINSFSIGIQAQDVEIRRTTVVGPDGLITASGTRNLVVEDCLFEDPTLDGFQLVIGNGARDCMVRRTRFVGGAGGVQFSFGSTGWVEDCTFEGVRVVGIDLSIGNAIVRRCEIGVTRIPIRAGQGRLEIYDTLIEGGTQSTIAATTTVVVRNSHILNAGGVSVFGRVSAPGLLLDLRENWWGTADESLIESWIDDEYGTVFWQPILTDAVSTEETSIGELKARFRQE